MAVVKVYDQDKTEQGELIMAYECDSRTADAEFLLTKARYKVITGRSQSGPSWIALWSRLC